MKTSKVVDLIKAEEPKVLCMRMVKNVDCECEKNIVKILLKDNKDDIDAINQSLQNKLALKLALIGCSIEVYVENRILSFMEGNGDFIYLPLVEAI